MQSVSLDRKTCQWTFWASGISCLNLLELTLKSRMTTPTTTKETEKKKRRRLFPSFIRPIPANQPLRPDPKTNQPQTVTLTAIEGASAAKKPKVQGGSDGSAQAESGPGLAEPRDELYGLNFLDRVKSEYRRLSLGNPRNVKSGVNSEDPQKNQSDECKNTGNACLPEPAGGYQGNVDDAATANPVEDLKDIEAPEKLNDNRVPADKKEEEKAPGGLVETTSGPSDSGSTQTQALGQNLPLKTLAPGINSVCHW